MVVVCSTIWHFQKSRFRRSFTYIRNVYRYITNYTMSGFFSKAFRIIASKTAFLHFGFMWKGFIAVYEEITLFVRSVPALIYILICDPIYTYSPLKNNIAKGNIHRGENYIFALPTQNEAPSAIPPHLHHIYNNNDTR